MVMSFPTDKRYEKVWQIVASAKRFWKQKIIGINHEASTFTPRFQYFLSNTLLLMKTFIFPQSYIFSSNNLVLSLPRHLFRTSKPPSLPCSPIPVISKTISTCRRVLFGFLVKSEIEQTPCQIFMRPWKRIGY
jgi:hypothetical protein